MSPFGNSNPNKPSHRWRLVVPLFGIFTIVAIAASLLYVSQVFERRRQEQRLISETLWAEQALSYEFSRLADGLQLMGRIVDDAGHSESEFRLRAGAAMLRSPELVRLYWWSPSGGRLLSYPPQSDGDRLTSESAAADVYALALRALHLRHAATTFMDATPGMAMLSVPSSIDAEPGTVLVAVVSLSKLLESTIPWWFAHEARISLEDTTGRQIAVRDQNVYGSDIYHHKIATQLTDQTLYLTANSSRGTPFLVPNLLALSVACLSILLAWAVYALWRDLELRTRTEATLREQQAFRQAMENSLLTGLRACDMQGRVTHVNSALCRMLGYSQEELLGTQPAAPPSRSDAEAHPAQAWETVMHGRDGARIDVLLHEAPLLDGSGRQAGWMASILNITEQRHSAEYTRQQNERMHRMSRITTMGEMASALAHELNQPLTAITSYLSGVSNLMPTSTESDEIRELICKASAQAERAGAIIRRVRQFVRKSGPTLSAVDLNDLMADVMPLVRLQIGVQGEEVGLTVRRPVPNVMGDRILLEQILLNLTKNGFEAMAHLEPAQRRLDIVIEHEGADSSLISVRVLDRGHGLASGVDVATSSFSTTKPEGMGMGLAVCRTALEFMGSRLLYSHVPGVGTEFGFSLRAAGSRIVELV